jgi:SHS2 domain-containing protein
MGKWQELDHTADLSIHVRGGDLQDLFRTAAQGMFALLTDVDAVPPAERFEIALEAPDVEALLVDWLNELLYLGEKETLRAFARFAFEELTFTSLRAAVWGGKVATYKAYIKAATYHNLDVHHTEGGGYEATLVFDV